MFVVEVLLVGYGIVCCDGCVEVYCWKGGWIVGEKLECGFEIIGCNGCIVYCYFLGCEIDVKVLCVGVGFVDFEVDGVVVVGFVGVSCCWGVWGIEGFVVFEVLEVVCWWVGWGIGVEVDVGVYGGYLRYEGEDSV